jgi:hypothetical protein
MTNKITSLLVDRHRGAKQGPLRPTFVGTLFKDRLAVAFFDRTARYFYLVDPSPVSGHLRYVS